jgi:hypothetical protein
MLKILPRLTLGAILAMALPGAAAAQSFEAVGSRAAGMGGAFVAVADDASAAYWNPAGFAAGSFFSMVIDRTTARVAPKGGPHAGDQSGLLFALGAPVFGVSYYRLRTTTLTTLPSIAAGSGLGLTPAGVVRLNSLSTRHAGLTLVQSIAPGVAVGATLKAVRGVASSTIDTERDHGEQLDDAGAEAGRKSSKFDADLGVLASAERIKVGLTLRNATEPSFQTDGESGALKLERQARAGVALMPVQGWIVAADFDLTKTAGPLEQVRDVALGTEARVVRKAFVRGGLRLNTAGDRSPSISGGASYAATGSLLIDAHVTGGPDPASRGWGVAARFGY